MVTHSHSQHSSSVSLWDLLASTVVRSSSFAVMMRTLCCVYITHLLVTKLFRNTYLSSSPNVGRWAARAGIRRSCAYTASNWRTGDRPRHGLSVG